MITHTQIKYILALVEHKNFQRAAESCFVTQPTLSMQIKKAEEILGQIIFDRDYSPAELTSFGRVLLPVLNNIQAGFDELDVVVQKSIGTYKAEIKIGIIPTVAEYLVPQMYAIWRETLNDVRLIIHELKSDQLVDALENRMIDFGIMAGPYLQGSLAQQILFNEEVKVYAPSLKGNVISRDELESLKPWLLSEGNCLRTQMMNFCNLKDEGKSDWDYEGGSMNLLLKMVDQEGGYTLMPMNYVQLLGIDPMHLKSMPGNSAARQVIGMFHKRTSKSFVIERLIKTIQHAKANIMTIPLNELEILPWK
jgi:LysR family transcriptional regulator, hydrogen peroxide-inducible genes activator